MFLRHPSRFAVCLPSDRPPAFSAPRADGRQAATGDGRCAGGGELFSPSGPRGTRRRIRSDRPPEARRDTRSRRPAKRRGAGAARRLTLEAPTPRRRGAGGRRATSAAARAGPCHGPSPAFTVLPRTQASQVRVPASLAGFLARILLASRRRRRRRCRFAEQAHSSDHDGPRFVRFLSSESMQSMSSPEPARPQPGPCP